MRNLDCNRIELDEIWGYIGKKLAHVREDEDQTLGDVWTYCAIDAETKLPNTIEFISDLKSRMNNRIQISSDAMNAYQEAIETVYGQDVDYAQIVKTYGTDESKYSTPERKYSPSRILESEKIWIQGKPETKYVSTSYVERLNASTRLHVKRLNRLTLAFSKKLENFEAAVSLHFASYNLARLKPQTDELYP